MTLLLLQLQLKFDKLGILKSVHIHNDLTTWI